MASVTDMVELLNAELARVETRVAELEAFVSEVAERTVQQDLNREARRLLEGRATSRAATTSRLAWCVRWIHRRRWGSNDEHPDETTDTKARSARGASSRSATFCTDPACPAFRC